MKRRFSRDIGKSFLVFEYPLKAMSYPKVHFKRREHESDDYHDPRNVGEWVVLGEL